MAKGEKTGGRQKGVPNKVTAEIKDMIRQALDEAGGVAYLKARAVDSPAAFLSLVGKILPKEVDANVTHTGVVAHEHRPISDTDRWLADVLGRSREKRPPTESVPH